VHLFDAGLPFLPTRIWSEKKTSGTKTYNEKLGPIVLSGHFVAYFLEQFNGPQEGDKRGNKGTTSSVTSVPDVNLDFHQLAGLCCLRDISVHEKHSFLKSVGVAGSLVGEIGQWTSSGMNVIHGVRVSTP
jgi:hypothetical protein